MGWGAWRRSGAPPPQIPLNALRVDTALGAEALGPRLFDGTLALRHDLRQDQRGPAPVPRASFAARGPRGHGRGARDGGSASPRPPDHPGPRLARFAARAGKPG